jgi:hypothetical protein
MHALPVGQVNIPAIGRLFDEFIGNRHGVKLIHKRRYSNKLIVILPPAKPLYLVDPKGHYVAQLKQKKPPYKNDSFP